MDALILVFGVAVVVVVVGVVDPNQLADLWEAPPQKKPCKFGHCPKRGGWSKRLPKLFVAVLQ